MSYRDQQKPEAPKVKPKTPLTWGMVLVTVNALCVGSIFYYVTNPGGALGVGVAWLLQMWILHKMRAVT